MSATGDSARFRAAMDIVDRALDLPADARNALLARECPDADLRAEVTRLLAADAEAGDFLSEAAATRFPSALSSLAKPETARASAGTMVGPFRLVSFLGKGGMGEVWIGERTGADFDQRVAVKLLPEGGDGEDAAPRFRRERRILARLSHPRIARLLDGGVTDGRPWLAMELVLGLTLTEHCSAKALDVDARLRLFIEICDAVQFAHRNLVVHRDLKPSNILVGANGEPKLLDFGIAKLLEEDDRETTAVTRAGDRPMTPDYAAPEQVRGEVVTTASDVWALGVILHELLTGVRPYRATSKGRGEVERAILEALPARPSSQVNAADGDATRRPAGISRAALRKRLKGDLDAIVLKAMRREPEDRYPSAETLASDVRRHLEGAPVAARGDATGYLIRAMVRRHRVACAFSAVVVLALVVGLVGTLWQARRAREEARKAEQAQEFLISMLRAFDPQEQGGKPITQRDILARGEARVMQELGDQPEVQARLLRAIAETWYGLGELDRALPPAERALALQRRFLARRSNEIAKTLIVVGGILFDKTDYDQAERLYVEALSIGRDAEGSDGPTVARALNDLAGVKRRLGQFAEAEKLRRQALDVYRRTKGDESEETLAVMNDLAVLLGDEGRLEESADLQRRTCVLMAKVRGQKHPDNLRCRCNLARDLVELGRAEEADAILREVYAHQVEITGDNGIDLSDTLRMRGRALDALGRPSEALVLYDDAMRREIAQYGADSLEIASTLSRKSTALRHVGRTAEAEAAARQALALRLARAGEDSLSARIRAVLGSALLDAGKPKEARDELARALAVLEKVLLVTHPDVVMTRAELARADAALSK